MTFLSHNGTVMFTSSLHFVSLFKYHVIEGVHIQGKDTIENGWKVQGNGEEFRSTYGISSGTAILT